MTPRLTASDSKPSWTKGTQGMTRAELHRAKVAEAARAAHQAPPDVTATPIRAKSDDSFLPPASGDFNAVHPILFRKVSPLPPAVSGTMHTPVGDGNPTGAEIEPKPGDYPTAAEAEQHTGRGQDWKAQLRSGMPGAGSVGFPVAKIDSSHVTDLKSLSTLEYNVLMQMRTCDNPAALYREVQQSVDQIPAGELREKFQRFVGRGNDSALRFAYWIRQSTPNGWAPGTYVPPAPNTLGDIAHGGRGLEDFHAYDWLQNSAQLDQHFHFADSNRTPNRGFRLCNNAYRLPQQYLMQYLDAINQLPVRETAEQR